MPKWVVSDRQIICARWRQCHEMPRNDVFLSSPGIPGSQWRVGGMSSGSWYPATMGTACHPTPSPGLATPSLRHTLLAISRNALGQFSALLLLYRLEFTSPILLSRRVELSEILSIDYDKTCFFSIWRELYVTCNNEGCFHHVRKFPICMK